MSFDEGNIEQLVNESFQISVVKKNIFDISVKVLNQEEIEITDSALMNIVNDIPLREFKSILNQREDKEGYAKRLEEIVKLVVSKYLKVTS